MFVQLFPVFSIFTLMQPLLKLNNLISLITVYYKVKCSDEKNTHIHA